MYSLAHNTMMDKWRMSGKLRQLLYQRYLWLAQAT